MSPPLSKAVEKSTPRRGRDVFELSLGCASHFCAHACHSRTGPATTDGVCLVLCRAFVLFGSAYHTSDTVILTSI